MMQRYLFGRPICYKIIFRIDSRNNVGSSFAAHSSSFLSIGCYSLGVKKNTCGSGFISRKIRVGRSEIIFFEYFFHGFSFNNSELKQVTFLTTRTSTGSKVDVLHQSQPLTQSSDVTHAVRVVKNVTCLSSLISVTTDAILAAARNHPEKIGSHGQSR